MRVSVRKNNSFTQDEPTKMGVGWLQVSEDESKVLDKGCFRARNWPSSTKAELLGIWWILLIVPGESKVKIYTNSALAMEGIRRREKRNRVRQSLNEENHSLLSNIV